MGYGNAGLVRLHWRHLPGNAFKALNEMAWSTMDDASPPVYYGGHERLAEAIGRTVAASGMSVTDKSAVAQVMRQLADAKAIERVSGPGPGKNAEYALYLWRGTGAGNVHPSTGAENVHPSPAESDARTTTGAGIVLGQVHESCSDRCTNRARTGAENVHLERQEEPTQESTEETTSPEVSTSPARGSPPDDEAHPHSQHLATVRAAIRRAPPPQPDLLVEPLETRCPPTP